jgi:hypothetical protein
MAKQVDQTNLIIWMHKVVGRWTKMNDFTHAKNG